jgi:hypothetical protein
MTTHSPYSLISSMTAILVCRITLNLREVGDIAPLDSANTQQPYITSIIQPYSYPQQGRMNDSNPLISTFRVNVWNRSSQYGSPVSPISNHGFNFRDYHINGSDDPNLESNNRDSEPKELGVIDITRHQTPAIKKQSSISFLDF